MHEKFASFSWNLFKEEANIPANKHTADGNSQEIDFLDEKFSERIWTLDLYSIFNSFCDTKQNMLLDNVEQLHL